MLQLWQQLRGKHRPELLMMARCWLVETSNPRCRPNRSQRPLYRRSKPQVHSAPRVACRQFGLRLGHSSRLRVQQLRRRHVLRGCGAVAAFPPPAPHPQTPTAARPSCAPGQACAEGWIGCGAGRLAEACPAGERPALGGVPSLVRSKWPHAMFVRCAVFVFGASKRAMARHGRQCGQVTTTRASR